MKNTIKASILCSAVLALASVGVCAQDNGTANSSTTIQITAMVSSFDNIWCLQPSLDLNGYMPITQSGMTQPQILTCFVTSNDPTPMNVTAYLPDNAPLTGINSHATIPNNFLYGGSNPGGLTPFQPLTVNGLTGNDGVVVASGIQQSFEGEGFPVNFFFSLNVPNGTTADLYTATLTIAITPSV